MNDLWTSPSRIYEPVNVESAQSGFYFRQRSFPLDLGLELCSLKVGDLGIYLRRAVL